MWNDNVPKCIKFARKEALHAALSNRSNIKFVKKNSKYLASLAHVKKGQIVCQILSSYIICILKKAHIGPKVQKCSNISNFYYFEKTYLLTH